MCTPHPPETCAWQAKLSAWEHRTIGNFQDKCLHRCPKPTCPEHWQEWQPCCFACLAVSITYPELLQPSQLFLPIPPAKLAKHWKFSLWLYHQSSPCNWRVARTEESCQKQKGAKMELQSILHSSKASNFLSWSCLGMLAGFKGSAQQYLKIWYRQTASHFHVSTDRSFARVAGVKWFIALAILLRSLAIFHISCIKTKPFLDRIFRLVSSIYPSASTTSNHKGKWTPWTPWTRWTHRAVVPVRSRMSLMVAPA